ncbi:hypothetical protein O181_003526 [Austropuccinia psidii MF-1]|uniref:Uncharacterized protein n=1 Tax=Austropuccinia psidii MF-1 TaxID=1389203 RepID=A0A9Q3GE83_9BASI|nr:hypothetical protein [Austropuccinia psidii MF-1]
MKEKEDVTEDESDVGEASMTEPEIIDLILEYIMWLYLECGLSKQKCQKARDQVVRMMEVLLKRNKLQYTITKEIPCDICTIIKRLHLDVTFEQYICCSECFSLYNAKIAPGECVYQLFSTSPICGADLFHSRCNIEEPKVKIFTKEHQPPANKWKHGQIIPPNQKRPRISKSTFVTQSFKDWMKRFSNVSGVEEIIDNWKIELESQPPQPIFDINQGSMWQTIFPEENTNRQVVLGFSLFIDWFNPPQNKLAGRQLSMGVIALNCLKLPPRLCYQTKYTFISGIIPGPKQPNMFTVNNILGPLANKLLEFNKGAIIPTPKHPRGCKVVVKLAALIGDIVATHKVSGFMSHSAQRFCTWCEAQGSKKEELKLGRLQNGQGVRDISYHYYELKSKTKKETLAKSTGVRCWFEGILQHQFRYQWGFDCKSETQHNDSDSESDDMEICKAQMKLQKGHISAQNKKRLLLNIHDVVVPKGVTRMPLALGGSQSGKLKASEWNALFNVYILLSDLDVFWSSQNEIDYNFDTFMINLCALVQCTKIVSSKILKKEDSVQFSTTYETYQRSSFEPFENIKINPNHHYAMHIPDNIDWWGPPMGVLEFAGTMEETSVKKCRQLQKLEVKPSEQRKENKAASKRTFELKNEIYESLFIHLKSTKPQLRDYRDLPHPQNALVLQNFTRQLKSVSWKLGLKISTSCPNNVISFRNENATYFGEVIHIIDLANDQLHKGPLLVVKLLTKPELRESDFEPIEELLQRLDISQVVSNGLFSFISMEKICGLAAYRCLPAWTLGIQKPTLLVRAISKLAGLETQGLIDNLFLDDVMQS